MGAFFTCFLLVDRRHRAIVVLSGCGAVALFLQLIKIPWGAAANLSKEPTTSCPIVLWIVGVAPWNLGDLLDRLGLSRSSSEVAEYHLAYVIFHKHS
jgi:hypothetical protein